MLNLNDNITIFNVYWRSHSTWRHHNKIYSWYSWKLPTMAYFWFFIF